MPEGQAKCNYRNQTITNEIRSKLQDNDSLITKGNFCSNNDQTGLH